MRISRKTLTAVLLTLAVITAGIGPALAVVAPDNETTNTTTVSDWQGGETVALTNDANMSSQITLEYNSSNATDASNMTLYLKYDTATNVSDEDTFYKADGDEWYATDSTNGHYAVNFTKAEAFKKMERGVNENVSVDVYVVVNEDQSDEETSTITVNTENGDEQAVEHITSSDVKSSSLFTVENSSDDDGLLSSLSWGASDSSNFEMSEEMTENTTYTVYVDDPDAVTTFNDAIDRQNDIDSQSWVTFVTAKAGNDLVKTHSENATSSAGDNVEFYAVHDQSDNSVSFETGDTYADTYSTGEEIKFEVAGNDAPDLRSVWSAFGTSELVDYIRAR